MAKKNQGTVGSAVKAATKAFKSELKTGKLRSHTPKYTAEQLAELKEKLASQVKTRQQRLATWEQTAALNFAYLLGKQDVVWDSGNKQLQTRTRQIIYGRDSKGKGTLQSLLKAFSVKEETENIIIRQFIQMITKTSERPFKFKVKPIPGTDETRLVKAHRAELLLDILQRKDHINFWRSRIITQTNTAIDGCHYLLPIYDKFAGSERVVYKATLEQTPHPLLDEEGQQLLADDKPLYATEEKETYRQRVGELRLLHLSFRDVLPPPGYTYLDQCPEVIFRTRIPKDKLDLFTDTAEGMSVKDIKEQIVSFFPGQYTYREGLIEQLYGTEGISLNGQSQEDNGEDELVEIYHKLVKPTRDYPHGRWMTFAFTKGDAGIVILQDKELPAQGRLGFPLIEVYALKVKDRFQGLTLLEFARPAQDRHNEMLTQRMWNMRKAGNLMLFADEESLEDGNVAQIPSIGLTVVTGSKYSRATPPHFESPPQIAAELFKEDLSAQEYIERLWGIPDLPTREQKSATEIAIMTQGSQRWVKAYGLIGQAQAYSKVGLFLLHYFKTYAQHGLEAQYRGAFNEWETELFLQSDVEFSDAEIDMDALTREDELVRQQKLQLWAQVDPDYFKTPQGRADAQKLLDLDQELSAEKVQERRNAIAENYQIYSQGHIVQSPAVDEDDITHLVEHLGSCSDAQIKNLSQERRNHYTQHVLMHCLKHHVERLEKFKAQGLESPIADEYIARVRVAAEMAQLLDEEGNIKELASPTEQRPLSGTPAGLQIKPTDLVELIKAKQAREQATQTPLPPQLLLAALLKAQEQNRQGTPMNKGGI